MNRLISVSFIVLLSILLFPILFSCSDKEKLEQNQESRVQKENEVVVLDVETFENENHQLLFNISIKDFIKSYNSFYSRQHDKDYLPPVYEWPFYNTMAIHSDNETLCYHFSEDESIRAIPKISVFVPVNDDAIQQIMISYDDHSYSIPTYEMYEAMCIYTLKTMMPDLEDDEATKLCNQVNTLADENISNVSYSSNIVPCALYYKEGVGVYPYYCIGEELRFCIIPVTEEKLQEFKERGTDIIAI